MVFNLPVSPSQTARQTAAFPALTRIYSLQRWAVSSGRRPSVRINRNREETATGLSFDQVTAIALNGGYLDTGQIVGLALAYDSLQ